MAAVWSQQRVSNRRFAPSAESPLQSSMAVQNCKKRRRTFSWPTFLSPAASAELPPPPPPLNADGHRPCLQSEGLKELQMDQASDHEKTSLKNKCPDLSSADHHLPLKRSKRQRRANNKWADSPERTYKEMDKKRKRDTEGSTISRFDLDDDELEERLNQREDDLYQLDLLLGCINEAIKQVEKLLENIQNYTAGTVPEIDIQNYLSFKSLMCIEQLYGNHGLEVMNVLKKNVICALPVILARLRQKKEEWSRCRACVGKRCW